MADITDYVAWWGAITGSLVLIWDVYKYFKGGLNIAISARPNMEATGIANRQGRKWILVTLTNRGTVPSTISLVGGDYYSNIIRYLIKKPNKSFIQGGSPLPGYEFPYVLQPGTEWHGTMAQDEDAENMGRNGYLICIVRHSARKKPLQTRIVFPKN